jgi:hypothetical protein
MAAAAPGPDALKQAWEATAHDDWRNRPVFTDEEWAAIAEGEILCRRDKLDGVDRAVGAAWTSASIDALWVSINDPHFEADVDGYVSEELPGSTFNDRTLYQRIDLPWPFAARQWVVDVSNNRPLIAATDGAVWERTWSLTDARGAKNEQPDAVWIPVNEGGMALTRSGEGTLAVYHLRMSLGGNIPNGLVSAWSVSKLEKTLDEIRTRAETRVPAHYVGDHEPVEGADGEMVPVFDAKDEP